MVIRYGRADIMFYRIQVLDLKRKKLFRSSGLYPFEKKLHHTLTSTRSHYCTNVGKDTHVYTYFPRRQAGTKLLNLKFIQLQTSAYYIRLY